ncbi:TIR domain-containing protein [Micromonospora orduensis]|uniref:TIR domain-containing protein n=1 Tax=Micromonospora orduensis TaxID=1420891 RepID=UPI00362BB360
MANTDAVLAVSALDRIFGTGELDGFDQSRHLACKAQIIPRLVDGTGALDLPDKPISNELQPRWHSVTWAALLYGCTRRWGGVQSSHNLQIAARLIRAFNHAEMGWRGPISSGGRARSWASSLALFNIYLLARDIWTSGLRVEEYKELMASAEHHKRFDVVISFSGADRAVAQEIRDRLVAAGLRVFFDSDYRHDLLGEDLAILLQDIYFQRSRFAVAILSKSFLESDWAGNWEWKAVLARMNRQREGYLLPYFLEEVKVPGLNPTIGYVSAATTSPTQFADIVARKVLGRRPGPQPKI